MSYQKFAYLYDELMDDVPYDEWVNWVKVLKEKYGLNGNKILDLACGTGELSVRLQAAGFDVTGVDLSEDMLAVANAKATDAGFSLPFIHQDMRKLDGIGRFDLIGIFCDSLNYLQEEEDVIQTFSGAFQHLKPGGLFLFDVHSLYKMDVIFQQSPFVYNGDNLAYIWTCFTGEHPHSVEHELSFFSIVEESGLYERMDEIHYQRTFEVGQYKKWLEAVGFEILEISADFTATEPNDTSERIMFTARKPSKE